MVELENEIISAFSGVAVTVSEAGVIQELLGVPPETKGRVILVQYENPKLDLWTWIHFQKMHPDFKAQVILFWLRWIAKLEVQRAYQA